MAVSAQIQRVSIKHEAIMDFLMSNPTIRLQDAAKYFGVTQAWLSTIIHSDAFQELLRSKQDTAFHSTVLPIREKMLGVAHQALDRVVEMLPFETETKTIASIAEGVLDRLGYGSKNIAIQVNNTTHNTQVNVLRNELEEARKLLGKAQGPAPEASLEVTINGERAPIALPREDVSRVGETSNFSAFHTLFAENPA